MGITPTLVSGSPSSASTLFFSPAELSPKSLDGLSDGQFVFVRVQVVAGEKRVRGGARESETRESSMEDCRGSVLAIHQKPLHPPTH